MWSFKFFLTAVLLGAGLAMDAFSVSLANGLNEPRMRKGRIALIAGVFALFQLLMPMLGWVCVFTILEIFSVLEIAIPWIALALLGLIGGKMLYEGIKDKECDEHPRVGLLGLLVQGIATSIDALSVGFTISDYNWLGALVTCLIIGALTFGICVIGVMIGKRFGTRLAGKASILGGVILIAIGIEIFITGVFG